MRLRYHLRDEPLPPDAVVVWNGAIERAHAQAQWRPAPVLEAEHTPAFMDPSPAVADTSSVRICDRALVYLLDRPHDAHTTASLAAALGITANVASMYLRRFWRRGVLEATSQGAGRRWVFHVKAQPEVAA